MNYDDALLYVNAKAGKIAEEIKSGNKLAIDLKSAFTFTYIDSKDKDAEVTFVESVEKYIKGKMVKT